MVNSKVNKTFMYFYALHIVNVCVWKWVKWSKDRRNKLYIKVCWKRSQGRIYDKANLYISFGSLSKMQKNKMQKMFGNDHFEKYHRISVPYKSGKFLENFQLIPTHTRKHTHIRLMLKLQLDSQGSSTFQREKSTFLSQTYFQVFSYHFSSTLWCFSPCRFLRVSKSDFGF